MRSDQNSPEPSRGVWITRAEPGASATAAKVSELGFEPIVAPLLTFHAIDGAALDLQSGEALAFTSVNGVVRTAALLAARDVIVFAVGDATAKAARAAGFSHVLSASGDVETLARLIIQHAPRSRVLHPAAEETAGDLVGQLTIAGLAARKAAVYRTGQAAALPPIVAAALDEQRLKIVLIHSPRAARAAAGIFTSNNSALRTVTAVGLSQACLLPLEGLGFQDVVSAVAPNEDALLKCVNAFSKSGDHV